MEPTYNGEAPVPSPYQVESPMIPSLTSPDSSPLDLSPRPPLDHEQYGSRQPMLSMGKQPVKVVYKPVVKLVKVPVEVVKEIPVPVEHIRHVHVPIAKPVEVLKHVEVVQEKVNKIIRDQPYEVPIIKKIAAPVPVHQQPIEHSYGARLHGYKSS